MAEYQHPWFHFEDDDPMKSKEVVIHNHGRSIIPSPSSSIGEDSMDSNGSSSCISSSHDTKDDASSSSGSSGALYDLSDIMAQLPIKRGLSKFYNGKSESFASLSSVSSLEDLPKKLTTTLRRSRKNLMKASRSCGNGLNNSCKRYAIPPKGLISKKPPSSSSSSRARCTVSSLSSKRVGFMDNITKPPTW